MKNLIDNTKNINQKLLSEIVATLEVYRIEPYISMVVHNTKYYLKKLLRKDHDPGMTIKSFESEIADYSAYIRGNDQCGRELMKLIRYHALRGSFKMVSQKAGADGISYSATATASKILNRDELKGKSVYELNDSVYRKYADRKKANLDNYLKIWLIVAILIIVLVLWLGLKTGMPFIRLLILTAVCELADYAAISRIIGIQQMARFVWMVISETGTNAENTGSPIESMGEKNRHELDVIMRSLHSVMNSSEITLKEKLALEEVCGKNEKLLGNNEKLINDLSLKNDDESRRLAASKADENDKLRQELCKNRELIKQKKASYDGMRLIIEKLKKWAVGELNRIWTAEYAPIRFSNDVIDRMVELFSIEDLKNVEKRLYEIRHTADPGSISRKANGRFELDFLTAQGGLAVIGFEAKANSITIINAGRQDRLIEPSVSNEELKEAAALIRSQKDPVDSGKLIQEIEKLTKGNSELIQEVDKLKKNEENLLNEITDKSSEIVGLTNTVKEKKLECQKLKEEIERLISNGSSQEGKELREKLEKIQNELSHKEQELQNALDEKSNLDAKLEKLNKYKNKLIKDLDDSQRNLSESKEKLRSAKAELENKKKQINEYNDREQTALNQIVTINGLLKKAEGNSAVDPETIKKIKKSKSQLEQEIKTLRQGVIDTNNFIDKLEKDAGQAKKEVEAAEAQINQMRNDMKTVSGNLLYRNDIFTELYKWIAHAEDYIYIIAPFVSDRQFNTMQTRLAAAVKRNPLLKIKILYGIQDRNSSGKIRDYEKLKHSQQKMAELERNLSPSVKTKCTNTHDKIVIVDDKKFMIGSANVFSFSGETAGSEVHDEIMMTSGDRAKINELKGMFFGWE